MLLIYLFAYSFFTCSVMQFELVVDIFLIYIRVWHN